MWLTTGLCFSSGECIGLSQACDGTPHCLDGSDEDADKCSTGRLMQLYTVTFGGNEYHVPLKLNLLHRGRKRIGVCCRSLNHRDINVSDPNSLNPDPDLGLLLNLDSPCCWIPYGSSLLLNTKQFRSGANCKKFIIGKFFFIKNRHIPVCLLKPPYKGRSDFLNLKFHNFPYLGPISASLYPNPNPVTQLNPDPKHCEL